MSFEIGSRVAHGLWKWTARSGTRRFRQALKYPEAAQRERLHQVLRLAEGSVFSKDHDLTSVTSLSEFKDKLPLRNWDELSPWRNRVEAGQQGILTRDPVLRLIPTSGSTQACKLVPTGRALLAEFQAALQPWLTGLLQDEPDLANGCSYWSISPPSTFAQNILSGFPVGFEDDTVYFGPMAALISRMQAVPPSVATEKTTFDFRQRTLSYLLRRPDLRFVSIWHPSFFELLLDHLEEQWDSLLHSLSEGQETGPLPLRRGDAKRARALRNSGPRPQALWPQLKVLSAWSDAASAGPAQALISRLPGVKLIPKGLVATEGIISLPWKGHRPLAVTSHFLEFLTESGDVLGAHQLEIGSSYEVVLTTSGGLWRLRTGDMVEVQSRVEATPSIRFLGRRGGIVDLCGEKLNEIHVMQCLDKLHDLLPATAWRMLIPAQDGKGYRLLLDQSQIKGEAAAQRLEQGLCENPHYAWARNLGQLRPVKVALVPTGAGARALNKLGEMGQSLGGAKPPVFDGRSDWLRWLGGELS